MLKNIYKSSWRLQWLRQAPLAEAIDALAGRFHQAGYSRRYSQRLLWIVGKFNDHARSIGIETAEEVNDGLMRHFAEKRTNHGLFAPIAMHHFAQYLRDLGIVATVAAPHLDDSREPILRDYGEHLCNVRGLALTSRTESLRYTRLFPTWLQNRHGDKFLDRLNGVDVLEFITELAGRHPSGSWRNNLCSYTRVFLRYLRGQGIIHVDLDRVVPKLPNRNPCIESWRPPASP